MAEINYVPSPEGNVQPGPHWGSVTIISGAPTGSGAEGDIRIDEDTGDFYEFENGAWVLKFNGGGGGGGGDPEVFHVAGAGGPTTENPVGDAAYLYNDVGNAWIWLTGNTWGQVA